MSIPAALFCRKNLNFTGYRCRNIDVLTSTGKFVWGSLLDSESFDEHSDIDIAVEGVATAEDFFALYGEAIKMPEFSLDLVQFEKIDPEHRKSITH